MKCRICGKEFNELHYSGIFKDICSSECFYDDYWQDKIRSVKLQPCSYPVVNGSCYHIDKETNSTFKGFGGRKFVIVFNTGEKTVTTNLWDNGKVPDKYKEQLPDNAIFE